MVRVEASLWGGSGSDEDYKYLYANKCVQPCHGTGDGWVIDQWGETNKGDRRSGRRWQKLLEDDHHQIEEHTSKKSTNVGDLCYGSSSSWQGGLIIATVSFKWTSFCDTTAAVDVFHHENWNLKSDLALCEAKSSPLEKCVFSQGEREKRKVPRRFSVLQVARIHSHSASLIAALCIFYGNVDESCVDCLVLSVRRGSEALFLLLRRLNLINRLIGVFKVHSDLVLYLSRFDFRLLNKNWNNGWTEFVD